MNTITKNNTFRIIEKARSQKKSPYAMLRKEGYVSKTALQALNFFFEGKPNNFARID